MQKHGGDILAVLRRIGIPARALTEPNYPIEASTCYQAMEDMAAELGDPFFGAGIARAAAMQGTPSLRESAAAARTLGDFLMRSVLETSQHFNNVIYSLCVKGAIATFEIERQRRSDRPTTQADAIGVAFYVTILRECLGETFDTKRIIISAFSFDGLPADFLPPNALVRSSGPALSLAFPAMWLFAPLSLSWAPPIGNSPKATQVLQTREPLAFLKSVIRENIATEEFDLPSLAASCGISIRSLQRIFADQKTSFRLLIDEIRREVAIDLAMGTVTPFKEISGMIGFSAGAAFCRSYRRWTGTSPSAHRRNSSGQSGERYAAQLRSRAAGNLRPKGVNIARRYGIIVACRLTRVVDGEPGVLLDTGRVARLNANGGLNQITIYYGQTYKDPSDPRCREILPASHKLHREVHGRYRIKRLLQDEWTDFEMVFTSAGYRILQRFPAGSVCPATGATLDRSRTLVSLTDEEARSELPGSTASFLFEFRAPRLDLTSAERRLLAHAASGMTDKDICETLDLSPNTLKASWRQIYEKFEEKAPHVLLSDRGANGSQKRGAEKRRRVVAFVNDHLEELRPYTHR